EPSSGGRGGAARHPDRAPHGNRSARRDLASERGQGLSRPRRAALLHGLGRVDPLRLVQGRAPRPARAALLVAGLLLALLAAGCGQGPSGAGPITLVFKHAKILGPADPVPGLLRRFEAEHPGVRVQSEALTWSSDEQHQFYVINLEGGSPPFDVMMLDVIWVPEFARAGWILDLTAQVPPAERDAHFASAIEPATQDGRLWALPWFMNVGLLYYRKDLLAKYGLAPPETYDELARQVRLIQAGERDPRLDGYLWQGKQYEGG